MGGHERCAETLFGASHSDCMRVSYPRSFCGLSRRRGGCRSSRHAPSARIAGRKSSIPESEHVTPLRRRMINGMMTAWLPFVAHFELSPRRSNRPKSEYERTRLGASQSQSDDPMTAASNVRASNLICRCRHPNRRFPPARVWPPSQRQTETRRLTFRRDGV